MKSQTSALKKTSGSSRPCLQFTLCRWATHTELQERHITAKGVQGHWPLLRRYRSDLRHSRIKVGPVALAHEQAQYAAGITEATELLRKGVKITKQTVLRFISVLLTEGQLGTFHLQPWCRGATALDTAAEGE